MKTSVSLVLCAAAAAAALTSATDVTVQGAKVEPQPATVDVRVATHDLLNNPTALINKNTLSMDNNAMIARSNVLLSQNDRLTLTKKVTEALSTADIADPAATAVLTKNMLRAVSAPDNDSALMTKASAVVAAKSDEPSALASTIADFVDAAMKKKEQAVQANTPSAVDVQIATKDLLRQPTGVINKNFALDDNQITIARSNVMPTQNDQVALRGAKVADVVAPAAAIRVDQLTTQEASSDESSGEGEELEKKKKKKKTPSKKSE